MNWFRSSSGRSAKKQKFQDAFLGHLPANPLDGLKPLPSLPVRYVLDALEFAVLAVPANWYRLANSSSWRSGGASVRLGGGMRLYSGAGMSESRLSPRLMSGGELVATSKRLLFVGSANSTELPFDEFLDLSFGPDAIHVAMKEAHTEVFVIDERIVSDDRFRATIVRLRMNSDPVNSNSYDRSSIQRELAALGDLINANGKPKEEYLNAFEAGTTLLHRLAEICADTEALENEKVLFEGCASLRIVALHFTGTITAEEADKCWVNVAGHPHGVFSPSIQNSSE